VTWDHIVTPLSTSTFFTFTCSAYSIPHLLITPPSSPAALCKLLKLQLRLFDTLFHVLSNFYQTLGVKLFYGPVNSFYCLPNPTTPSGSYLSNHIPIMCKPKSKHAANARNCSLPKAPWLYLNNSTSDVICGNDVANNLISLIPKAVILTNLSAGNVPKVTSPEDTIVVFVDHQLDQSMAIQTADALREKTIELAKNFTSVNLTGNNSTAESANKVDWGTNHLEVNTTQRRAPAAAEKIFKWLCKLPLPVPGYISPPPPQKRQYCLPAL
jgi:hypothetical protein